MLLYQIAITLIPGVGDINGKKLISYCGSAEAVFRESKKNLLKIPGMGQATVNSILSQKELKRAEQEIRFIERSGIEPLYFLDNRYPHRLKHCIDAPILLYFKGTTNINPRYALGIVGTRRITEYGREVCRQIVEGLADLGILIISGLAYGVDTRAHKEALAFKIPTVGVLAHGLDRIYPYANKSLASRMENLGGLISDFKSGTNPDRENFPKRNRIIAGMSDALLIIESAKKGGALITANIANSYNRDVFAVPGNLGKTYSEGCNYMIKTNKAALVQSADDIRYMMQWENATGKPSKQARLFRDMTSEERTLLEILNEFKEAGIDVLVQKSKLSNSKIASALLTLEFDGYVKNLPGNIYKII